jgi:hypothetical protein
MSAIGPSDIITLTRKIASLHNSFANYLWRGDGDDFMLRVDLLGLRNELDDVLKRSERKEPKTPIPPQQMPLKKALAGPATVEEAVSDLMESLSNAELEYVNTHQPIHMHDTLGRDIRNRFGMWQDNDVLLRDCEKFCLGDRDPLNGLPYPDEASQVVLIKLKERLTKEGW